MNGYPDNAAYLHAAYALALFVYGARLRASSRVVKQLERQKAAERERRESEERARHVLGEKNV